MAKSSYIETRRHFLPDFSHTDWDEMLVFRLRENIQGADLGVRNVFHEQVVAEMFEELYAEETHAPDTLMHVTCTGYASPSAPYRVISEKKWGQETKVTQLYHTGCFAAIPALRLATQNAAVRRTDIVHTELCSLHFDPTNFSPEQMVIHGLFADGVAKYSVESAPSMPNNARFAIDHIREEIIPGTENDMTWKLSSHGFQMTLARTVPESIEKNILSFVEKLAKTADTSSMIFAIHPGGPKIIDTLAERLELQDWQVQHSRDILRTHGNMSSATLPHIWQHIAADRNVAVGTSIVSMAFGPGLTLCGVLLKKVGHDGV